MGMDMQIGVREELLSNLMVDLTKIVDHCINEDESFDDFLCYANAELDGLVDVSQQSTKCCEEYYWEISERALEENLEYITTAEKAARVFELFKNNNDITVTARNLRGIVGVGDYKLQAILFNLHSYGLINVSKKGWRFPFNITITKLGKKARKDPEFIKILEETFMLPFPSVEDQQTFWAQRQVAKCESAERASN